ncbi:MAG: AMP-binding protein [Spirochaetota bacterium]
MIWQNYGYPLYKIESREDFRDMLDKTCERYGEELSFYEKNEKDEYEGISFNKFRENVINLGEYLLSLPINQRDKIALIGKNCRAWAISYYSITTSNFIVVPIDKELKENEIESIISISSPSLVICENSFLEIFIRLSSKFNFIKGIVPFSKVQESLKNNSIILDDFNSAIEKGSKLRKEGIKKYDEIKINPKDCTSILFTSGTTGKPKGVMLSQFNIVQNIVGMRKLIWIDDTKYFLSVLPLHHAYECTCGFLCQVHAGSKIVYAQSLKKLGDNIKEGRVTNINVVPLLLEALSKRLKEKLSHSFGTKIYYAAGNGIGSFFDILLGKNIGRKIRRMIFTPIHKAFGGRLDLFISGGAAVKPEVSKFLQSLGFRVLQGYGISECSPFLAANRDYYFKNDAAGMPLPEHDFEIFEKDEEGVGEIAVKGDSVMLGYYNDPEATEKTFSNGYFLTGDYGFIDKDGFIYIKGRKKNVIVTRNGKNIYPEDIEVLYENSQIISEIVVDEMVEQTTQNETIIAYIYPNFENLEKVLNKQKESIQLNDIIPLVREEIKQNNQKISAFKRIHYFSIYENEFEKTTTKKIKRQTIDKTKEKFPVYS